MILKWSSEICTSSHYVGGYDDFFREIQDKGEEIKYGETETNSDFTNSVKEKLSAMSQNMKN